MLLFTRNSMTVYRRRDKKKSITLWKTVQQLCNILNRQTLKKVLSKVLNSIEIYRRQKIATVVCQSSSMLSLWQVIMYY